MIRPVIPASPLSVRPAPQELAAELQQAGVDLRLRRPLGLGWRPASPREVAARLGRSDPGVQVVLPGVPTPLPVASPGALHEVAVFAHLRPADTLAQAALISLEQAGMAFLDARGRPVGPYGAWRALEEQRPAQATLGEQTLPLSRDELPALAEFYRDDPLAQLELEGYQFFDPMGHARAAWGPAPPEQVGQNGIPWMELQGDLPERIHRFEQILRETGEVSLARRLLDLPLTPEALRQVLDEGDRVLPAVMRALQGLPPAHQARLANELSLSPAAQAAWLEQRAGQSRRAAVALRIHRSLRSPAAQRQAFRMGLTGPEPVDGAGIAALLKPLVAFVDATEGFERSYDQQGLGQVGLSLLADFPDTCRGAQTISRWQPVLPLGPLRRLLDRPSAGALDLALGAEPGDVTMMRNVLDELASPVSRAGFEEMTNVEGQLAVYRASLAHGPVTSGVEAAAMLRAQAAQLSPQDYASRQALGRSALSLLQEFPDTRATAARVAAWNPILPYGVARALLAHPTASSPVELRQIARGAEIGDNELMKCVLTEMTAEPSTRPSASLALSAFDALQTQTARQAFFQAALAVPELGSGVDAAALLEKVAGALDGCSESLQEADRDRLGRVVLQSLQEFPDTRQAAARVAGWQPGRPYALARALLRDPLGSSTESFYRAAAESLTEQDAPMAERLLASLAQDPASRAGAELAAWSCQQVQQANTRWALVRAALACPCIETEQDIEAYYGEAMRLADGSEAERLLDLKTLQRGRLQLTGKNSQAVAEEAERVVVGGVTLRKRRA